ncbi:hypothetical protein AGMMS49938_15710 [Fibrobacterales bacterium]|nr:hypothetical protein AGMMS49938_15710 [Fibrobacterales bacterium]
MTLPKFGYVMDLLPSRFSSFVDYLNGKINFTNCDTMILAALNLVNAFRDLHRKGYFYKDLNDGNFFIDMKNGDIKIIDNDNIGTLEDKNGVIGKSGYIAPEIVTGSAAPSTKTDRHSIAVVLFKLFMKHDPFMGKFYHKFDIIGPKEELEIYGKNPIFIFHPSDIRNYPTSLDKNAEKFWKLYPKCLKDRFIKTFVDGIKNPCARTSGGDWQTALIDLRANLAICEKCGEEFLLSQGECDKQHKIGKIDLLHIGCYNIPLFFKQKLFACHTAQNKDDYKSITAEIVKHKKNGTLAIQNLGDNEWSYLSHKFRNSVCKKGGIVKIHSKLEIDFGRQKGNMCSQHKKQYFLRIDSYKFPLDKGMHIEIDNNEIGQVQAKKDNPEIIALKNLTNKTWIYIENGIEKKCEPQKIFQIKDRISVNFCNSTGYIKLESIKGEQNHGNA